MVAFTEGQEVSFSFSFQAQDLEMFQRLSGDTNPIHHDAAVARKAGFDKPVVYGGLLVAKISQALGTQLPGPGSLWHSLSIQFHNPLFVGEEAQLLAKVSYVSQELKTLRLDLEIHRGKTLIAKAKAQTNLPSL